MQGPREMLLQQYMAKNKSDTWDAGDTNIQSYEKWWICKTKVWTNTWKPLANKAGEIFNDPHITTLWNHFQSIVF